MNRFKEVKGLKCLAEELQLDNREILDKYKIWELACIYNGIGSDAFPDWLRGLVTGLNPTLAVVAFIHDVEWHESDGSREKFTESNTRFKANGYAAARQLYGWYNPRRYLVMNQARKFGNICQLFGYPAWNSPCECAVCRKKEEKEHA